MSAFKLDSIASLAEHLKKGAASRTTTPPSNVRLAEMPPPRTEPGPSMRPLPRSVVVGSTILTTPVTTHNSLSSNGNGHQQQQQRLSSSSPGGPESIHTLRIVTHTKKIAGRLIIVGDVHGCPEQLQSIVDQCQYNRDVDTLVIAGDLVNKGPDSQGAVRLAMDLGAYAVLGNHDITALNFVEKIETGEIIPTQKKYARDQAVTVARTLTDDAVQFLRRLPHIIKFPQFGVIVVHAGFNVSHPMEAQTVRDVTNLRRLVWNEQDGVHETRTTGTDGTLWAKLWEGPETVVFGHDARTGLQQEPYAIGLDSGCCYGGSLTAVVFPGGKLYQVPGLPMATRSTEVTPAAPVPSFAAEIEAAFPQQPSAALRSDDSVSKFFENSRLRHLVTPPSAVVAAAPPSTTSPTPLLMQGLDGVRWHTLQLLLAENHILAVLTLLQDEGYQSAWSMALEGTVEVPSSSWGTVTCSCTKYVLGCDVITEEAQNVLDLLVEVLNEKKDCVSAAALFEVQKLIAQLEGGAVAGVTKGGIKALKLSLK